MKTGERIALWVGVGLLAVGLLVSTVLWSQAVADLRLTVEQLAGARPPATVAGELPLPAGPTPNVGQAAASGVALTVRVTGVQVLGETTVVSLTVRGDGAADPLLDLPVLLCGTTQHPVDGPSLEQARLDLLQLITAGEAAATLRFAGAADLAAGCTLLLNPGQDPASIIAPRLQAPVPVSVVPPATPTAQP